MKLSAYKREGKAKGETKKIRRQGDVPAVLYGPKFSNENIYLKGADLEAVLRNLQSGRLGTTIFTISLNDKKHQAIVKDIQYDVTSYRPIHVDFEITNNAEFVKVNIPIELSGAAECQGVKLGGALRSVIRRLKVRCLPNKIPEKFTLDIKDLGIGQSLRLSDIELPEGVRPLARMEEVAVAIAKR